jgi:hypothetical protein
MISLGSDRKREHNTTDRAQCGRRLPDDQATVSVTLIFHWHEANIQCNITTEAQRTQRKYEECEGFSEVSGDLYQGYAVDS